MTIVTINDDKLWDKFVEDSPYGMLFHKSEFLNCMRRSFGGELLKWGIYDGNKLIAIIPLYYKKVFGLTTIFSPPPGSGIPYLGFVINGEYDSLKQDKKELWLSLVADNISKKLQDYSSNYASFTTVPFLDIRPFKWYGYDTDIEYSYLIDLERPIDEIQEGFKKDLRKQIKRAEQFNPRLIESRDLSMFYELNNKRYNRDYGHHFFSFLNENYLKEILEKFPEHIKLYYLYQSGKIVTVLVTSEYKGRIDLLWGNPRVKDNLYANEYLIWKLIQDASAKNFKKFVIVGANLRTLCGFKSKFNPGLEFNFSIHKKNTFGNAAEYLYRNLLKEK